MPKFVFRKSVQFEAPVIVVEPGSGIAFDFVGVFELQPIDAAGNRDIIAGFKGWRGIGCDGAPNGELEVNDANRAALLAQEHVRLAVVRAYLTETQRLPEKNVETPAALGPAPARH